MGFRNSLSASGYAVLNVIRGLNVISLLLVMAASIVMVVKTIMVSSFYIFDGITHIITFFVAAALLTTEINVFQGYLSRNWPLFGNEHGFVTLGLFMMTMAVSVLGNLNKEATSVKSLGTGFYQLVMAAGILTFIMSFANLIANYMFRQIKLGVTARMVRAHGKQARRYAEDVAPVPAPDSMVDLEHQSVPADKYAPSSYYSQSRAPSVRSNQTGTTFPHPQRGATYNISHPMPAEDMQRPQSAVHPAHRGNAF
jgi:hypothetical protein